jgi:hypothetical protein
MEQTLAELAQLFKDVREGEIFHAEGLSDSSWRWELWLSNKKKPSTMSKIPQRMWSRTQIKRALSYSLCSLSSDQYLTPLPRSVKHTKRAVIHGLYMYVSSLPLLISAYSTLVSKGSMDMFFHIPFRGDCPCHCVGGCLWNKEIGIYSHNVYPFP